MVRRYQAGGGKNRQPSEIEAVKPAPGLRELTDRNSDRVTESNTARTESAPA